MRLPQHDLARHDHLELLFSSRDHSELDHAGSFTRSLGQFRSRPDILHKIPWLGRWKLPNSDPEDGTDSKKQKKSKEMMASEQKKLPN